MSGHVEQHDRLRGAVIAVIQYGLLFGFAAVAAAISAQGLTGFARTSMGLHGPWPYLLWGALDGAACLCAVLLMRRTVRGEAGLGPRLAVWGLVAASSAFNWTHAPHHPSAREAFALMPVIAAVLFEFSLRETRHAARPPTRRPAGPRWARPGEWIRVRLCLAVNDTITVEAATHQVRAQQAARRLYLLRRALSVSEHDDRPTRQLRVRRAELQAQAALTRARFADSRVAAAVLRQVQVLTWARTLARLDYTTPDDAQAALSRLIPAAPRGAAADSEPAHPPMVNGTLHGGHPIADAAYGSFLASVPTALVSASGPHCQLGRCPGSPSDKDGPLVAAATRIVLDARQRGMPLSQTRLAGQLRAEGHGIANGRLNWLSAASGLKPPRETP
jgi:hypothetical protein